MNARPSKAARPEAATSVATLLAEIEIPNTSAFDAFEAELDAQLAELEERFSDYVTRNSLAAAVGR